MKPHHTQTTLRYLADLAPTGSRITDVIHRVSEFAYLGWRPDLLGQSNDQPSRVIWRRADVRRLASIDSLHSAERLLRLGWMFVSGTIDWEGKETQFCLPLMSVPVQLESLGGVQYHLSHRGDVEMPDGFLDEEARLELETASAPYGGDRGDSEPERLELLRPWVDAALAAAGLPAAALRAGDENPLELRRRPGLAVIAGAALYTIRDVTAPNVAGTLLGWMSQPLAGTAFDVLYRGEAPTRRPDGTPAGSPPPQHGAIRRWQRRAFGIFSGSSAPGHSPDRAPIRTPLPLNRAQREALERSRSEHITVISGPPGTGKSHLVAAAAVDEIARGNSVLIATQSDYAAGVIAELVERNPGPRYVRFGSRDHRESVAADLGDGLAQPLAGAERSARDDRAAQAEQRAGTLRRSISQLLGREAAFADGLRRRDLNLLVTAQLPGVLADGFDVADATRLLGRARANEGLLGRWRSSRAERELRAATAADPATTIDDIEAALDAAAGEGAVQRGLVGGGLSLDTAWRELETAEAEWRNAIGLAIEAQRRARRNGRYKSTRAVAALASALRAGRVKRRQILRELSGSEFLDVLPLWIGTLQDIDNTLPVTPAMFDVVIFDEASQIDQMRAAPALARAKRAMVVGDPRQLRHVSFVSDDAMESAAAAAGMFGDHARMLDVRRNSLFDAAAAVSPVTWLDEHFRSVPHIIAFSDRAFYGGNLRLMTQHPRSETRDAIRTVKVDGNRNEHGVNGGEIDAVLREVENLAAAGERSIGIVSPFRAQADALEEAILAAFGPEDVDRLGLRVGTVHAFQGSERDVIVASLAIAADDAPGSLRFLQNPNLFNVLVTRARNEMIVVTSVDPSELPKGLLQRYLHHAEHAPLPSETGGAGDGWTGEIDQELQIFGVPTVTDYPVAGWSVDLAVGAGDRAFGVECRVHPDGAEAHIEQHLALRRAGWSMADAFQSRWLTDPEGAAEMLSKKLLRADRS